MNILRIDSSVRIENSKTRSLADYFITQLGQKQKFECKTRDVGIHPPHFPTNEFIIANYTPAENRSATMQEVLRQSDTLIAELKEADTIIIAAPMYNFSIPAQLKAYIDNIVRIGETFVIGPHGEMQGLLSGKKLLVITSRGAMSYEKGGILHAFDFQENYVAALFNFMGVQDIQFVHTEGQDFGAEEIQRSNFEASKSQLLKLVSTW